MPEDRLAEGVVTRAELAELARLFDESENSFDPAAEAAAQAKAEFNQRVKQLFDEHVVPNCRSVDESSFCAKVRTLCREYLRRLAN